MVILCPLNPIVELVVLQEIFNFARYFLNSLALIELLLLEQRFTSQFAVLDLLYLTSFILVVVLYLHVFQPVLEVVFVELLQSLQIVVMHYFSDEIAKPEHNVVLLFNRNLAIFCFRVSKSMPHWSVGVHLISLDALKFCVLAVHQLNLLICLNLGTLNHTHYLWIRVCLGWSLGFLYLSIERLA